MAGNLWKVICVVINGTGASGGALRLRAACCERLEMNDTQF